MGHKKDQLIFIRIFVKKSTDFNVVFTFRLKNERRMWWYEFRPPHLIDVAACLVKFETPKMHMNTNSAFNESR